ncbi:transcriptional regulator [Bacillus wiedmannii]|nr:transcriptional regulator [Bacillus wiedmannii]OAK28488.1 transcriptional regulator [Bacillus wiedmannii]
MFSYLTQTKVCVSTIILAKVDRIILGDIMKKILIVLSILMFIISYSTFSFQANAKEPDNDIVKYALIRSLSPSIDKALTEIYNDATKGIPSWAGWDTEIMNIKQLYGIGGAYDVKVRVSPYYGPHIGYGIDEITVRVDASGQQLIEYKHIQDV